MREIIPKFVWVLGGGGYRDYIGVIIGVIALVLYWENGKENRNYYSKPYKSHDSFLQLLL